MHLAEYLFRRIHQLGIRSIFGVPGDFNLASLDYIVPCGLNWVGNVNELNGGYAADGYARIRGIGAIMTTLGVGELSAINALAGSCAEHVPVIHIVGYPSTSVQEKQLPMHHTMGDGDFGRFAKMSAQVSSAVVILKDKSDATKLIDETILECCRSSKPVYIGFPTDLVSAEVDPSPLECPLGFEEPNPNTMENEEHAVGMILDRIRAAQNPVIIVDSLAGKSYSLHSTRLFVQSSGFPCFTTPMAKGVVDESLPNFCGLYAGKASETIVLEQVKSSDLILAIGPRPTDFNSAGFKPDLSHIETIKFERHRIQMPFQQSLELSMSGVLERLSNVLDKERSGSVSTASTPPRQSSGTPDVHGHISPSSSPPKESVDRDVIMNFEGNTVDKSQPLTQDWIWQRMASWLEEDDIISTDVGTSAFGTLWSRYPRGVVPLVQFLWSSIGYAVGAAVGAAIAAREDEKQSNGTRRRRTICLTGDGSLQMTAQEVSTMVRRKLGIIMFIVCNEGYTVERIIHGMDAEYNDIQPWDFKLMPALFRGRSGYCSHLCYSDSG
ncbi:Thiamine pyrophosphate enzyme C-terminal TPP-binding [Penicillium cf. griseofulvum]|nr:Thiamine pyrophosphate enzyme C-terminal TPP-binding [Penicillium cf. griseofulvum]